MIEIGQAVSAQLKWITFLVIDQSAIVQLIIYKHVKNCRGWGCRPDNRPNFIIGSLRDS